MGALGAAQLPDDATAYLGLVPIAIGLYAGSKAWRHRHDHDEDHDEDQVQAATTVGALTVAGVTLANGGDNVGVYISAFATHSGGALAGIAVVFLVLVAVWCVAGYYLTAHHAVTVAMQRWGHVVYPLALIAIGVAILVSGGAFGL